MADRAKENLNNVDADFCVVRYGNDLIVTQESLPSQNLNLVNNLQIIAGDKCSVVIKNDK